MSGTPLPRDPNSYGVQIVAPSFAGGVESAFTGTAARLTLADGRVAFQFTARGGDCRILFGDSTVTAVDDATSVVFLAGSAILAKPKGATHVSVIGLGADTGLFQAWPVDL